MCIMNVYYLMLKMIENRSTEIPFSVPGSVQVDIQWRLLTSSSSSQPLGGVA